MKKNLGLMFFALAIFLISFMSGASAAITLSACGQNLNASGSYLLNQSITSTATCLTTNSSNVEIDCAGNTITYGTAGGNSAFGINALHASLSQVNLTVKNCIIVKTSAAGSSGRGISLTRFANSTITNNTIRTNGTASNMAVYVITGSDGNNISRNTIVTSGTSSSNQGISLNAGSAGTIIDSNNITAGKGTATTDNYGVYVSNPRANITNNIISTFGSGDSNFGVYSTASTGTRMVNNTIYTSGATGNNGGVYLVTSDLNVIANNTINTTGQSSPGIYLSTSNSVNVLNNQINSTADSIYMTSSVLSDFTSTNISRDNTRFGRNITVYGGGALTLPCPNNTVIDNPADGALKFFGCNNITIRNWYRPNRDTDGLLFVNSDYNKIINNTINGGINGLDMVNTAGQCDNNTIVNNTFSSFGYMDAYAIRIYGTYNLIDRNNVSTSGVITGNNGINIQNDFNNITNNVIATGGTSGNLGINLEANAKNNLIQNNTITTSGTSGNTGIYFVDTCTGNIVRNNTITATGTTSGNLGMRLVSTSNNNVIEYNTFYTKGLTSGNNGIDLSSSSNNSFRFNNVYAGYGVGTTDNDAVSLVSSGNNNFTGNALFANGTVTSITSSAMFLQSNSVNNTFTNNIITKSVGNAIELDFSATYPSGNTFQNNSLANVGGSDLFFLDPSINGTSFIDQPIGRYNFTGIGGKINVENTLFGKIVFTSLVNGTGTNMSNDIQISSNLAQVNSSQRGLNASANISFYNLTTNFFNPSIKRDGTSDCNSTTTPACINFTSLNAGNVSFSVGSWSNYSIAGNGESVPPAITIVSPANSSYNNRTRLVNISSSDSSGISRTWFYNGTVNVTYAGEVYVTFSEGTNTLSAWTNDTFGNINSTSVVFSVDSIAPTVSIVSPANTTYNSNSIFLNYSAADTNLQACWYQIGASPNITLSGCTTATISATEGSNMLKVYANDSVGNVNYSQVVFSVDSIAPQWSSVQTGTQASYSAGPAYFNVTWTGSPQTVLFESNFTGIPRNYSMYLISGNIYGFNSTIGAGTFYWKSYANDSAGNVNSTTTQIFTIAKAGNAIYLYTNGNLNQNSTVSYGTQSNATATADYGAVSLYRDGTAVSNPELSVLAAKTAGYNYTAFTAGNENYSSNSTSYYLIVNQANSSVGLYLDGSESNLSRSYGNSVNVTAVGAGATLYRNGVVVSSPDMVVLGAGSYNYTAEIQSNENTTGSSKTFFLTVNRAAPSLNLLINGAAADGSITYGTGANTTGYETNSGDGDLNYVLYRNGIVVSSPDMVVLGAGSYNYTYNTTGGTNYSSASVSRTLTINPALSSIQLFLNGNGANTEVVYGVQTNATALGLNGNPVLYRNGVVVSSPDMVVLGAGSYNYTAEILGSENVSGSAVSYFLNITKAVPSLNLLINGADSDLSISTGTSIVVNASSAIPLGSSVELYEDGVLAGSGLSPSASKSYASAGDRIWRVNISESENYTSAGKTHMVSAIDSSYPQYSNLKESPSDPGTYSSSAIYQFNATWTDNIGVSDVILEFNGINYSLANGGLNQNGNEYYRKFNDGFSAGTYSYKWYANDTSNNWVSTAAQSYTIDKGVTALFLTISPSSSINYGTTSSISCSANNAESTTSITRNAASVLNPDSSLLGAGTYNYACTAGATQNYTSASATGALTVNKATPVINLTLNGAAADLTLPAGGGDVSIIASLVNPSSGNINLTRDGTFIAYGISPLTNTSSFTSSGSYAIGATFYGNENYSSKTESRTVTVSQPSGESNTGGGSSGGGGGGSSGGGGGGAIVIPKKNVTTANKPLVGIGITSLSLTPLSNVIVNPGESKKLTLSAKNSGTNFLNSCQLIAEGESASWINFKGIKSLSANENYDFIFDLNAPETASIGKHQVKITIKCLEVEEDVTFDAEILEKKLEIALINAKKTGKNEISVTYSLKEYSGRDQNVEIELVLFDKDNVRIAEKKETRTIKAFAEDKFETKIEVLDSEYNNLNILINANSDLTSTFVKENLILGNTLGGFAVISDSTKIKGTTQILAIAAFVAFAVFMIRRIIRSRRKNERMGINSTIASHYEVINLTHRHEHHAHHK